MIKLTKEHQKELISWLKQFYDPRSREFKKLFRDPKKAFSHDEISFLISVTKKRSNEEVYNFSFDKKKMTVTLEHDKVNVKKLKFMEIKNSILYSEEAFFSDSKHLYRFALSRKPLFDPANVRDIDKAISRVISNDKEFLGYGSYPLEIYHLNSIQSNMISIDKFKLIFKKDLNFLLEIKITSNKGNEFLLKVSNDLQNAVLIYKKDIIFFQVQKLSYHEDRIVQLKLVSSDKKLFFLLEGKSYFHGPFQNRITNTLEKYCSSYNPAFNDMNHFNPTVNFLIDYKLNQLMLKRKIVLPTTFLQLLGMQSGNEDSYKLKAYLNANDTRFIDSIYYETQNFGEMKSSIAYSLFQDDKLLPTLKPDDFISLEARQELLSWDLLNQIFLN